MIHETMINAERYEKYVDETLCSVNGYNMTYNMTFEEWECYQDQMLKYYSVYQYDNGPYIEDEDDSSDEDEPSDDDNHDRVCLCDPTDFNAGACCCNHLGLECDGQCHLNGYDRWLKARQVAF